MPFVTFEGPEGAGKTTQIHLLAERLRAAGQEVLLTREPGGTPFGKQLRHHLLHDEGVKPSPLTTAMLFMTDRAHHVDTVIKPALANGTFVLCDRFTDSTLALQGYGQGLDLDVLRNFCQLASDNLRPELTLMLLVSPQVARERATSRTGESNNFDSKPMDFYRRVDEGFRTIAAQEPERVATFDGELDRQTLSDLIWSRMERKFGLLLF